MKKMLAVLVILGMAVMVASVFAAEQKIMVPREAKILSLEGSVSVLLAGKQDWELAQKDMILKEGDQIKTEADSKATLNIDGNGQAAVVEVSPNTSLTLQTMVADKTSGEKSTLLDLAIGKVMVKCNKLKGKEKFEVGTPTSVLGVRGTQFEVEVMTKDSLAK